MFNLSKERKGFTFVELAIVLVIIGIIMGLGVKGRTLIRSAKMRAEIRKIDKLQTALMSYINMYKGVLPNYDDTSTAPYSIDYNLFLEQDLIKMSDIFASLNATGSILNTSDTYPIWGYAMCGVDIYDNYSYYAEKCDDNGLMICPNICIAGMKLNADKSVNYSPVLMEVKCSIEAMADDKDYANGAGRLTNTSHFEPSESLTYSNAEICSQEMNYRDFDASQADTVGSTYVYRIY
ncbi:MAG: type II secretion system GspH family protein [Deferribacteraceae bacterium]|jgi:prepilin-type N-terminal cleavage/methylation domain-containing protein|nr:type II secretion system GspH family protein [Deferribacteraceae bacterium]